MTWQPIETAPKDGTEFLAWDGLMIETCWFKDGVLLASWDNQRFSCDTDVDCDATHWMPLPEPPA